MFQSWLSFFVLKEKGLKQRLLVLYAEWQVKNHFWGWNGGMFRPKIWVSKNPRIKPNRVVTVAIYLFSSWSWVFNEPFSAMAWSMISIYWSLKTILSNWSYYYYRYPFIKLKLRGSGASDLHWHLLAVFCQKTEALQSSSRVGSKHGKKLELEEKCWSFCSRNLGFSSNLSFIALPKNPFGVTFF